MSIFYRILFVVIAISIPIVCILGALNIVYRMPDLYVYEFNKFQVTDEVDLAMKDDELGQFFSDFMTGKQDEFNLFAEYRDREQTVFGAVEQMNMENARRLLNKTLYIIGGAAALMVISSFVYLIKKKKYELRIAFKGGILLFAIVTVILFILFNINQSREILYSLIFINPFGADDVLPLMLTEHYAQLSLIAVSVVGLVLLVILASVLWRLTKPRRMFW